MNRRKMGARYPGAQYRNQYGNLLVMVESRQGEYVATVTRPSDGFEISIGTSESSPADAARYALQVLADGSDSENSILRQAAQEMGQDAAEALAENSELSGSKRDGGNMFIYVVTYYDGNTMPGEVEFWVHKTEAGAKKRQAEVLRAHIGDVENPATQGEIAASLDDNFVERAVGLFEQDGGPTGMQAVDITKVSVGK